MNSTQRLTKQIATAFAAILAVTIIGSIVGGGMSIIGLFSSTSDKKTSYSLTFEDIDSLSIASSTNEITIKEGTEFKVEATNVSTNYKTELKKDGTLDLHYEGVQLDWFGFLTNHNTKGSIIIYLPGDFIADEVQIDSSIETLTISHLTTKHLDINASTGNIIGTDITADRTDIDASVGNIDFNNVRFTNADINCSVGNIKISGALLGENEIDGSTGNLTLNLIGNSDDYNLSADTSVGTLKINGDKYSESHWNNLTADHSLDIDGSVGNIYINFEQ